MAVGLQAVQMLRTDADIGEQFCEARLGESMARNFGTLNAMAAFQPLIDRALLKH